MNTFGRIFRVTVFGASHGPGIGVVLDGVPPGLTIQEADFLPDLERRKGGKKGTTPRKEEDYPVFQSGVFNGFSTGAPLTIFFENKNIRSADYEQQKAIPRPGHADFVAHSKFHAFEDYRGGGHFSARLTVGIVAAGTIARKILIQHLKLKTIKIDAKVIEVGGFADVEAGLQHAIAIKDSVGGLIEGRVSGLPVGLGEPFWDSLESLLAHAFFAIPAVKGVSFGSGFKAAQMTGTAHNDVFLDDSGKTKTNFSGGISGGISNGNELTFQIAIKPTSSTPQRQESWNRVSKKMETFSIKGRHDLCVALRAPVIAEAMTALVLADVALFHDRF